MSEHSHGNPMQCSKYMGEAKAQIPLRITPRFIEGATYHIEHIDRNLGYQAEQKYKAAQKWIKHKKNGGYVWLCVSGAATPVGMGGLIADLMARGLIDVVVSTGANVYHDLHFACCLPVRHGSANVDDNDLRKDETTRIYTQFIHNKYTLKAQDAINQLYAREVFKRLKLPFSTTKLINELGKEFLEDKFGYAVDKKGSFVLRAAEFDVPIFLDSGSNHSLAMDLVALHLEGIHVDTSPSLDILESSALSVHTQPELIICVGESGPKNFAQTAGPTASEIMYIPFEGSDGYIAFTTSDPRTGGLSGTKDESKSWNKYGEDAEYTEVWGEYTLTFPDVAGHVAGQINTEPSRLVKKLEDPICKEFLEKVKENSPERMRTQEDLRKILPVIQKYEMELRRREGYVFE